MNKCRWLLNNIVGSSELDPTWCFMSDEVWFRLHDDGNSQNTPIPNWSEENPDGYTYGVMNMITSTRIV